MPETAEPEDNISYALDRRTLVLLNRIRSPMSETGEP